MPPRKPVDLSNVEVDFSGVARPEPQHAAAAAAAELLLRAGGNVAGEAAQGGPSPSSAELRAYDPRMKSYVERHAQQGARRRRQLFAPPPPAAAAREEGKTTSKGSSEGVHGQAGRTAADAQHNDEEEEQVTAARQQEVTALLTAHEQTYSTAEQLQRRKAHYLHELRSFCHRGLPESASTGNSKASHNTKDDDNAEEEEDSGEFPCGATQSNSLLRQLFADGVPDMEPWDRWAFELPRYDARAFTVHLNDPASLQRSGVDAVHTEVLPDTYYTRHYQHDGLSAEELARQQDKLRRLCKTKDELRAERRARLREKQLREQKERAAGPPLHTCPRHAALHPQCAQPARGGEQGAGPVPAALPRAPAPQPRAARGGAAGPDPQAGPRRHTACHGAASAAGLPCLPDLQPGAPGEGAALCERQ